MVYDDSWDDPNNEVITLFLFLYGDDIKEKLRGYNV